MSYFPPTQFTTSIVFRNVWIHVILSISFSFPILDLTVGLSQCTIFDKGSKQLARHVRLAISGDLISSSLLELNLCSCFVRLLNQCPFTGY